MPNPPRTPEELNLPTRVEREPPSRELDAEIALAKGWTLWRSKHDYWYFDGPNGERVSSFDGPRQLRYDPDTGEANPNYDKPPLEWLADQADIPCYTSSVDHAMTLVPAGAGIELHRYWLMSVDDPVWSALLRIGNGDATSAEDAPSAASALCAAALRALEAARRGDG